MVAGGQGTRPGISPDPKGVFEIGTVSKKSVYQIQSEKVLGLSRLYSADMPFSDHDQSSNGQGNQRIL